MQQLEKNSAMVEPRSYCMSIAQCGYQRYRHRWPQGLLGASDDRIRFSGTYPTCTLSYIQIRDLGLQSYFQSGAHLHLLSNPRLQYIDLANEKDSEQAGQRNVCLLHKRGRASAQRALLWNDVGVRPLSPLSTRGNIRAWGDPSCQTCSEKGDKKGDGPPPEKEASVR